MGPRKAITSTASNLGCAAGRASGANDGIVSISAFGRPVHRRAGIGDGQYRPNGFPLTPRSFVDGGRGKIMYPFGAGRGGGRLI